MTRTGKRHGVVAGIIAGAGLLLVQPVFAQDADAAAADKQAWVAPKVNEAVAQEIIKRNIFLADRAAVARDANPPTRVVTPRTTDTTPVAAIEPPAPPDPDTTFVLVGVTVLDGTATAFIEDRAGGGLKQIDKPGPFSKGEITAIDLTGLTYIIGDEQRSIGMRQNFLGKDVTPVVTSTFTQTTTSSSPASTGSAPSSSTLSLLERMRLRRQQESQPTPPPAPTPAPATAPVPAATPALEAAPEPDSELTPESAPTPPLTPPGE